MATRRSILRALAAFVGESLREIAVLIMVFAPLDMFVQGRPLTTRFIVVTILSTSMLIALGFFLEVRSWKR